ncbi:hypothetical protein MYXA107069_20255 [Myxococcus xanthus]|nr:hypothetical protein MyxoNM_28170 [Myxococcus xanthus]SDX17593.1 Transposase, Mutator family [Myxococcus xanthus]
MVGRVGVRNGNYLRTLVTTAGAVDVVVPRTRRSGSAGGVLGRYTRRPTGRRDCWRRPPCPVGGVVAALHRASRHVSAEISPRHFRCMRPPGGGLGDGRFRGRSRHRQYRQQEHPAPAGPPHAGLLVLLWAVDDGGRARYGPAGCWEVAAGERSAAAWPVCAPARSRTSGGRPHRLADEALAAGRHHAPALHRVGVAASLGVPGASASPRANLTRFHGVFAYPASDVPDRVGGCNSNGAKHTGPACLAFGRTGLPSRTHAHGYWAPAFPGAQDRR